MSIAIGSEPPFADCRDDSRTAVPVTPLRTTPVFDGVPSIHLTNDDGDLTSSALLTTAASDDDDDNTGDLMMMMATTRKGAAASNTTILGDEQQQQQQLFTPYPFHQRSKEEIEDFQQLELSFGEDWSLQFADEISCCGMSVDTDDEASFYGDDNDEQMLMMSQQQQPGDTLTSRLYPEDCLEDTEEVKSRRNQLWKQSLKTSMFQRRN